MLPSSPYSVSILEEFGKVFTKCHNGDQGGGGQPRSPCLPVSFTRSSSVTALWGRARDDVSPGSDSPSCHTSLRPRYESFAGGRACRQ